LPGAKELVACFPLGKEELGEPSLCHLGSDSQSTSAGMSSLFFFFFFFFFFFRYWRFIKEEANGKPNRLTAKPAADGGFKRRHSRLAVGEGEGGLVAHDEGPHGLKLPR